MAYKYENIVDLIKRRLIAGSYKPGAKLPSVQAMSKELSYNADTVVKAYKQLESEHLIYAVPKSGFYAVKSTVKSDSGNTIDMLSACPPEKINPYKDFCHCMEKAVELYGKKLFEYSSPKGMPELVNVLVKHLTDFHIFAKHDDIFVTNGSQQALFILGAIPFPGGGTKVIVEQPTYSVMLNMLKCSRTPVIGIERTQEGIDLDELESLFRKGDIKFFYTMPRFQNPTGFCYSSRQKKDILGLARRYGVHIVEDDYLADLEPDPRADPLYGMGEQDLTVYVRSFSKTLLPGLRLGMGVLPADLQEGFLTYKRSIDINTPVLTQGALEIYLKSSMYRFHMQKTKKHYEEKMDVLREETGNMTDDSMRWHIPDTGIYAYMETEKVSSAALEDKLSKRGVLVCSTKGSYLEGFPHPEGLRLCVCNIDDNGIRRAVRLIGEEIKHFKE